MKKGSIMDKFRIGNTKHNIGDENCKTCKKVCITYDLSNFPKSCEENGLFGFFPCSGLVHITEIGELYTDDIFWFDTCCDKCGKRNTTPLITQAYVERCTGKKSIDANRV